MSGFVEYVTEDGDRWDAIAWKFYGDEFAYERIIAANPTVPITPTLEGGLKLAIPVIDRPTLSSAELPPWRR